MTDARENAARGLVERLAIESGEWGFIRFNGAGNPWAIAVKAVLETREECAKVADDDSATLSADAKQWHSEKMYMAGDASEQQARAGLRIAAAIRNTDFTKGEEP